jgi:dTDP-4-dehydrorhamnose reductase
LIFKDYLILGASGFLGSHLARALNGKALLHLNRASDFVEGCDFVQFNLKDDHFYPLDELFKNYRFKTVINCIANTDIEDCEKNEEMAFALNSLLPKKLAKLSKSYDFKLIQISTDAVFDGKTSFRREQDTPLPETVYGRSKLKGEQEVLKYAQDPLIARVNFVGHSKRKLTLFDSIYRNLRDRIGVTGYTNVFFTPLLVNQTASAIIELDKLSLSGVYHVAGRERLSKFEFAKSVCEIWELDANYLSAAPYNSNIPRAMDLSLDTFKMSNLGIEFPKIVDSLLAYRQEIKGELE